MFCWVFFNFHFEFWGSFGGFFHGRVERKRGGKVQRKEDQRMKRKSREGEREKYGKGRQNAFQGICLVSSNAYFY